MTELKLTRVGNSVAAIIPKDVLARLHLQPGDSVFLTESPDGVRLTAYDPEFAEQMAIAERVMHEDRDALRELAR
ncbi:MAG TPA: AbrB/MazE/SpoVT family DNA-binding domain-containing protein [Candidatus Aquilonibacter sp.]